MTRNRSFDEAEVLNGAMMAFREHGFAGASIKDLERATGLTSGSLYNAFGDKEGLYRATAQHYLDSFVRARVDAYAGKDATLDDLEGLFLSLLEAPLTDGYGCMATNAIVEFGGGESVATSFVRKAIGLVSAGIRRVLERELGPEKADTATEHLVVLYQGMLVFSRAGWADERLAAMVRDQFNRLRAERTQT
jgi:AcrR family transcriptional regulator